MLVNMREMLHDAEKNNYAVGSINTPNLETLRAVIGAAEELNVPIMINHAQGAEPVVPIETIAPLMLEYAKNAKVPVCVHIDHALDLQFAMKAVRLGFTSIMYDFSHLPLEQNIAEVKKFVDLVHPLNITVEAELGAMPNNMPNCVPGQEKSDLSDLSVYYTNPDEARRFCLETGVDVLTVSFGTVHGIYADKPNLDIERVKKIKSLVADLDISLGMHGASGTDKDQIRKAIDAGIRKINYFTGMDTAPAAALLKYIEQADGKPVNYSLLANVAMTVLQQTCKETLQIFMNR